jgi:starch synthase
MLRGKISRIEMRLRGATVALNILKVTAEAYPLAKSGGLGDAVSGMAEAMRVAGVDVSLLMPAYRGVLAKLIRPQEICVLDSLPGGVARLVLGQHPQLDVPVYLLVNDALYDRTGLYGDEQGTEYADNPIRFGALAHAATLIAAGRTPVARPDVVHAHDWHAALVPLLIHQAGIRGVRSVLTVHNLAFQGIFDMHHAHALRVQSQYLTADGLEYWGKMNFMKAGLLYADRISAVSRTYTREILSAEFGCGLEGVLQARRDVLLATPNGIDDTVWDPSHPSIAVAHRYSAGDLNNKAVCKVNLQTEFGLAVDASKAVMVMCSRLTTQKMADLAVEALPRALATHPALQLVVLGQGDKGIEQALVHAAAAFPNRFSVRVGFDESTAHLMHSGGDVLLHGSRFEPFGLTPIYAMRYGTLPIGSKTGGMADTITDAGDNAGLSAMRGSTGFLFEGSTADAMVQAIDRALAVRTHLGIWRAMQTNAMTADFSWRNSVAVYMRMYHCLVPAARFLRPATTIAAESVALRHAPTKGRVTAACKSVGMRMGRAGGALAAGSAAA